jgi:IPT/TIG domain
MRAGSIVIVTAALTLASVVSLANSAAAAAQPVVGSVSPGSGTIGTPVTITGSGFDYGCTGAQSGQVYFGGQLAANATVTDTAATAVAPTHEAGTVNVQVEDCLGDLSAVSSATTFVYPAPVVSSVSPGSGTIGTPVTITGSGFDYGCTGAQSGRVYFGGQLAANATVTDTAATAVAPRHEAGTVYVQVEDCLGDLSARRADLYTYLSRGPRFFGLRVYGTESREATVVDQLLTPGVLALRVMRVGSDGRLVSAGLVSFGHQPRGRSLIHWNFRINHRLLGPGRYELTLYRSRGGVLSAPAAPGARTLLVLKEHRVRVPR